MGIGTLTLNLERYRVVDYATFFFGGTYNNLDSPSN